MCFLHLCEQSNTQKSLAHNERKQCGYKQTTDYKLFICKRIVDHYKENDQDIYIHYVLGANNYSD